MIRRRRSRARRARSPGSINPAFTPPRSPGPQLFRDYLTEQLEHLVRDYRGRGLGRPLGAAKSPSPMCWTAASSSSAASRPPSCRAASRPPSWPTSATRSPTASGTERSASRGRWRCSTGCAPTSAWPGSPTTPARRAEHFQRYVLFTNYHRYVDEFVRWGGDAAAAQAAATPRCRCPAASMSAGEPTDAEADRGRPWRRHQMPAYHLMAAGRGGDHPGQHRRRPVQRQDHLRPPGGAAPRGLADDRPLRRPARRARRSATTCWPTPICATTMCWTTCCRRKSRSRRSPRCRWR